MSEVSDQLGPLIGGLPLMEHPLPRALADCAEAKTTGTVIVRRGNIEKRIILRNGAPVLFESTAANESLDQFLVKRGKLNEAQAFQLKSKSIAEQRDIGQVLLSEKALGPNELYQMMKLCMGNGILTTFRWHEGTVTLDPSKPPMEGKILLKVNPGPLVMRGVCSFSPFDMISKHFLAVKCSRFQQNGDQREVVAQLKLNPIQGRIALALANPAGPNELAQVADADMETVLRVLYALWLLKRIIPDDGTSQPIKVPLPAPEKSEKIPVSADAPSQVEQPPPAAAVARIKVTAKPVPKKAEPDQTPKRLTNDEERSIDELYRLARSGSYYDLLGVDQKVTFSALKEAFLKKCHAASPMTFRGRDVGSFEGKLEEIFLILVRAFSTLAVPGQRQTYNAQLESNKSIKQTLLGVGPQAAAERSKRMEATSSAKRRKQSSSKDEVELESHALAIEEPDDASVLLRTGITFLNARQPAEAVEQLEMAIEDNPNDAQSTALLGYALYLCDPISNVSRALDFVQRATSIDGQASEPHLYLGRILEQEQHRQGALSAYETCLTLHPEHSEASEAAGRLRQILRKY